MSQETDEEEDLFDDFLRSRGHEVESGWSVSGQKRQCPECSAIHPMTAQDCDVCGWVP